MGVQFEQVMQYAQANDKKGKQIMVVDSAEEMRTLKNDLLLQVKEKGISANDNTSLMAIITKLLLKICVDQSLMQVKES